MAIVLQLIGYGWFLFGLINVMVVIVNPEWAGMPDYSQFGKTVAQAYAGGVLITHVITYWAPGLIVGALGTIVYRVEQLIPTDKKESIKYDDALIPLSIKKEYKKDTL